MFVKNLANFKKIREKRMDVLIDKLPIQIRMVCISEYENSEVAEVFLCLKDGSKVKIAAHYIFKGVVNLDELKEMK